MVKESQIRNPGDDQPGDKDKEPVVDESDTNLADSYGSGSNPRQAPNVTGENKTENEPRPRPAAN
ncbi:unnamed protein product [Arabis nemorensis]|uniref:Uncharacterized protein n=1 Tax=Arabis nemorensis TaxID=586526 RepID=A0A565CBJ0_9BRAS|nr:unnamed protein product [Arabis nemorensis]